MLHNGYTALASRQLGAPQWAQLHQGLRRSGSRFLFCVSEQFLGINRFQMVLTSKVLCYGVYILCDIWVVAPIQVVDEDRLPSLFLPGITYKGVEVFHDVVSTETFYGAGGCP